MIDGICYAFTFPNALDIPSARCYLNPAFISHFHIIQTMNSEMIIGLTAATLTTVAYIPQAIKIIRTKHTKDLSLIMYIVLTVGIILWLVYGVMLSSLPIILANIVTVTLTAIILALKIKYR